MKSRQLNWSTSVLSYPNLIAYIFFCTVAFGFPLALPCPTKVQFFAFRVLIALSAASAIFLILNKNLKTSSGNLKIAITAIIFLIIYTLNPRLLDHFTDCRESTFSFSVQLNSNFKSVAKGYPGMQGHEVSLWIENTWVSSESDHTGVAYFKSLPGSFQGQTVPVKYKHKYWAAIVDSIRLTRKSNILNILPPASLLYSGLVLNGENGVPLHNAKVQIGGQEHLTDSSGQFTFNIPTEDFLPYQNLFVSKSGYRSERINIHFQASSGIEIALFKLVE
ncbi:MAG: carboxypeptidase-like regulatory domain-containing protein [bacterium]|nr:carboxypeptidase-like regulatory domain-containing protein [bacterium]